MGEFGTDFENGTRGVNIASRFLAKQNWVAQIKNKESDLHAQLNGGGDIETISHNNKIKNLEIKCDTRYAGTGNLFIETIGNVEKGTTGWINYSNSDYICYLCVNVPQKVGIIHRMFRMETKGIMAWAKKHLAEYPPGVAETKDKFTKEILYHTAGQLVPAFRLYKLPWFKKYEFPAERGD